MLTDGNSTGNQIDGIGTPGSPMIFWGAKISTTAPLISPVICVQKGGQTYGPLPASFPNVGPNDLNTSSPAPCIALAFLGAGAPRIANMEQGNIDGYTPTATFTPAGVMTGILGASAVYSSGTFYGATAWQDLGTTGNTSTVTFTYQGTEASGGAAAGVRWNDSAQQGIFAYIDSSGPTLKLYEMSSGWVFAQSTSVSLTLTAGNSYTLTVSDAPTIATASITDDTGRQTSRADTRWRSITLRSAPDRGPLPSRRQGPRPGTPPMSWGWPTTPWTNFRQHQAQPARRIRERQARRRHRAKSLLLCLACNTRALHGIGPERQPSRTRGWMSRRAVLSP
jgi:hypothetical protein